MDEELKNLTKNHICKRLDELEFILNTLFDKLSDIKKLPYFCTTELIDYMISYKMDEARREIELGARFKIIIPKPVYTIGSSTINVNLSDIIIKYNSVFKEDETISKILTNIKSTIEKENIDIDFQKYPLLSRYLI